MDIEQAIRDLFARSSFAPDAQYSALSQDHVVVSLPTQAALRIAVTLLFDDNYVISKVALSEDDDHAIMVGLS
jgi:hypothetical protein